MILCMFQGKRSMLNNDLEWGSLLNLYQETFFFGQKRIRLVRMLYIEQFVYSNKLRDTHPIERVLFALLTMVMALVIKDWKIHILIISIMFLFLIFRAGIKASVILKLLSIPLGFLLIGVFTIALQISSSGLDYLISFTVGKYFIGITETSLISAVNTLTVSLSAVSCLYFLALTTPMVEIIYVLQLIKIPETIIELMVIIYRFIFVFINTAFSIYYAQQARYGHSSFSKSLRSFAVLFANLWGKAFFKSKNLLQSLESRGFEGNIRVLNPEYKFSLKNILIFSTAEVLIILFALIK